VEGTTQHANRPLLMEEFLQWISNQLELTVVPSPSDRLDGLAGGDPLRSYIIFHAFDELTDGVVGRPAATIYMMETIRDLYLHYLEALSRPIE
jgi:hypothetical protein